MSRSELHDWECAIEKLSSDNADKMLAIAQDIYNTAFVRGKNDISEDCISRQAAIDALHRGEGCGNICRRAIERFPSTESAELKAIREQALICSTELLKLVAMISKQTNNNTNFCPNCGCEMEVKK